MFRLRQAKCHSAGTVQSAGDELLLLLGRSEITKDQYRGVIAHDRVLVLQIVVKPQALRGQMFADHGHPQIGSVLASILPGQGKPVMTSPVSVAASLAQQRLPFR